MRYCTKFHGDVELLLSYDDLTTFQNVGYPAYWIFKTETFNCRYDSEGQHASLCKISWQSVKPFLKYGDYSIFSKWRQSTILNLL